MNAILAGGGFFFVFVGFFIAFSRLIDREKSPQEKIGAILRGFAIEGVGFAFYAGSMIVKQDLTLVLSTFLAAMFLASMASVFHVVILNRVKKP